MRELDAYKTDCLNTIYSIAPSWGAKDYSQFIIPSTPLEWNKEALSILDLSLIATIKSHLERIVESKINPLNNF